MPETLPNKLTTAVPEAVLQVPPVDEEVKLTVPPRQTAVGPEIAPALGKLVTVNVTTEVAVPQIPVAEYTIFVVPPPMAVTTPLLFTRATLGTVLLHTPPETVSVSWVVSPWQSVVTPVIDPANGEGFTKIARVAVPVPQLFDNWYVIVAEPAITPVITPNVLMVAIAGELLLHVPPPVALVNVVVNPGQTLEAPLIAATVGAAVTVNGILAVEAPQILDTL